MSLFLLNTPSWAPNLAHMPPEHWFTMLLDSLYAGQIIGPALCIGNGETECSSSEASAVMFWIEMYGKRRAILMDLELLAQEALG